MRYYTHEKIAEIKKKIEESDTETWVSTLDFLEALNEIEELAQEVEPNNKINIKIDRKKLIKDINDYFGENNKNFDHITYNDLLWYLETSLIWYKDLTNDYLKLVKLQ